MVSEEEKEDPTEVAEKMGKGSLGFKIYWSYFSACKNWSMVSLMVFSFIFTQILSSLGDYWCSKW